MSLDVSLYDNTGKSAPGGSGIFVRENGSIREITATVWNEKFPGREPIVAHRDEESNEPVFSRNITHNLGKMADAAGLYLPCWRPEEMTPPATLARDLVEPLRTGVARLRSDRPRFEAFNPENGWGDYDGLLAFAEAYLTACETYPDARVSVSR